MPITRRTFLGASLAAVVLAACGGDDDGPGTPSAGGEGSGSEGTGSEGAGTGGVATGALVTVQFFPPGTFPNVAGQRQRWPFGLGDTNGVVVDEGAPPTLDAYIRDLEGNEAAGPLTVPRHNEGLARPYYPLVTELAAGQYQVTFVTPDGTALQPAFFTVQAPGTTKVPVEGQAMPSFPTPTTADARGVDPICTAQPACPFHAVSLDEAMAAGTPVALLVGTPAYCATGICGPVLGLLEEAAAPYGDRLTVVHAEVYTDDTLDTATDAVATLGLDYEPSLFVIDGAGVLRHRLDVIYDTAELTAALADVAGAP